MVYAVQFDIAWEDKSANHRRVEGLLDLVDPPAGSLIVLPELFDIGFSMSVDRMSEEATNNQSEYWCSTIARRLGVYVQGASVRQRDGRGTRGTNNAVVFDPAGHEVCRYEKIFPFSGGRETEAYRRGTKLATFEWNGMRVCPLICYDLRFPELWRLAVVDYGAEMFTIGASWPAVRHGHWLRLLEARAIENQAWVVGVNRCGKDPNLAYGGGSRVIDPQGKVLAEADAHTEVIHHVVDPCAAAAWRGSFEALKDVKRELLGKI